MLLFFSGGDFSSSSSSSSWFSLSSPGRPPAGLEIWTAIYGLESISADQLESPKQQKEPPTPENGHSLYLPPKKAFGQDAFSGDAKGDPIDWSLSYLAGGDCRSHPPPPSLTTLVHLFW